MVRDWGIIEFKREVVLELGFVLIFCSDVFDALPLFPLLLFFGACAALVLLTFFLPPVFAFLFLEPFVLGLLTSPVINKLSLAIYTFTNVNTIVCTESI
jgi:hypothetical protein